MGINVKTDKVLGHFQKLWETISDVNYTCHSVIGLAYDPRW